MFSLDLTPKTTIRTSTFLRTLGFVMGARATQSFRPSLLKDVIRRKGANVMTVQDMEVLDPLELGRREAFDG